MSLAKVLLATMLCVPLIIFQGKIMNNVHGIITFGTVLDHFFRLSYVSTPVIQRAS